jgi:hypothetical protein
MIRQSAVAALVSAIDAMSAISAAFQVISSPKHPGSAA